MSSRLRSNVATIFDVFVELCSPSEINVDSRILWKYPDDYFDEKVLKHVVEFAFPCRISEEAVQLFSFVLTNVEGKYTFGYCRHAPRSSTCYCILSSLPWSEFFFKLLNHVASLSHSIDDSKESNRKNEIELLLVATYHQEIPNAGETFVVETNFGQNRIECACPDNSRLPKIPNNRHLTEYYNAVDEQNMIAVWASMLCERRIVMVSSKLGRLSSCVLAANMLIYPMHWQHIFIPVLPENLFNYLHAPMPFLIGVPSINYAKALKEVDMSDIVHLNIDTREFKTPFNDLASLPNEVLSVLKKSLRNSNHLLGDGLCRSFLRALVVLIGGYREALQFRPGESILFSPDLFITSRSHNLRPFLTKTLELQIFRQFIEDKLEHLNSGFDGCLKDEFEEECSKYAAKEYGKFKNQYNEWFGNMKKEGGALMKHLKTKVRTRGKEAMRDIKYMLNELKDDTGLSSSLKQNSNLRLKSYINEHKSKSTRTSPCHQKIGVNFSSPDLDSTEYKLMGKLGETSTNRYKVAGSTDQLSNKSDSSIERRKTCRKNSSLRTFDASLNHKDYDPELSKNFNTNRSSFVEELRVIFEQRHLIDLFSNPSSSNTNNDQNVDRKPVGIFPTQRQPPSLPGDSYDVSLSSTNGRRRRKMSANTILIDFDDVDDSTNISQSSHDQTLSIENDSNNSSNLEKCCVDLASMDFSTKLEKFERLSDKSKIAVDAVNHAGQRSKASFKSFTSSNACNNWETFE